MAKREFLMLAHKHNPDKHGYCGYFASEKLDGIRCFWDGGISRGLMTSEVPWANTAKDARYKNPPRSTGLWTRYLKSIQAPDFFLDSLPQFPLDGELDCGNWQLLSSIIKDLIPDEYTWQKVKYMVFDSPAHVSIFEDGEIKNSNCRKIFNKCFKWAMDRCELLGCSCGLPPQQFAKTYYYLVSHLKENDYLKLHEQVLISSASSKEGQLQVESLLSPIIEKGGEGLILRSPISIWKPERSHNMLKIKPFQDMEGTVVGYKWGDETNVDRSISGEKIDRLVGLMGSIRVRLDSDVQFDLASGFTLEERALSLDANSPFNNANSPSNNTIIDEYINRKGKAVSRHFENKLFPLIPESRSVTAL